MCLPLLRLALLLLTECGAPRLWPSRPPAATGTAPTAADQQRLQVHLCFYHPQLRQSIVRVCRLCWQGMVMSATCSQWLKRFLQPKQWSAL